MCGSKINNNILYKVNTVLSASSFEPQNGLLVNIGANHSLEQSGDIQIVLMKRIAELPIVGNAEYGGNLKKMNKQS
jgi:hypothetical protein